MAKVKNPNDVVDEFVSDYRDVLGDELVSVIMYGSAVTHEYRPGRSDINMAIVVKENSIPVLNKVIGVQRKWGKRSIAPPFFMTEEYISSSLDTYPIEFYNMQSNYRVLYGNDVLAGLDIKKHDLRLQCERELRGIALHLRKGFVEAGGDTRLLGELLDLSFKKLLPILKALLVLHGGRIPQIKSEVIGLIEDIYGLGVSALSDVANRDSVSDWKSRSVEIFDGYAKVIDTIILSVDQMMSKGSE